MRIAIWGGPGAGKSSLAAALSERLGISLITEYATEWLSEHGVQRWAEDPLGWQAHFAVRQKMREEEARGDAVSDSPSGLAYVYSARAWGKTLSEPRGQARADDLLATAHRRFLASLRHYTHHFFAEMPDRYQRTPIRPATATEAIAIGGDVYKALALHGVRPTVLRDGPSARIEKALKALEGDG